ncbi:hypothetical protein C8Q77DRAFT_1161675 [Trametes polyzona]|nr:hypothetical protein C8Q77DRAFT_1161675 [Trametes polyzona]
MNQAELKKLKRPELQRIAKLHGVKANLKTDAIIAELLQRFPGGVPSSAQDEAPEQPVAESSTRTIEKSERPAKPLPKVRKTVALQRPQKGLPVSPRRSTGTAPLSPATTIPQASFRVEDGDDIPVDNALGLVPGPVSSRTADAPSGYTSSGSRLPERRPDIFDCAREEDERRMAELMLRYQQEEYIPGLYSISTGIPPEHRQEPVLAQAVQLAINGPHPLDPSRITQEPLTIRIPAAPRGFVLPPTTMEADSSSDAGAYPPNQWPRAVAGALRVQQTEHLPPSSPPADSQPEPRWEYAPHEEYEPVPRPEPLATEEQMKAVVGKIIDISRVQKQRWKELNELEPKAVSLARSVSTMRTLVDQERANRVRMQNFLAYWRPVSPDWKDADIWDKAARTRIDEYGYEVEITSEDEEEFGVGQTLPPGARPTEVEMRRVAYRHPSEDQDVRVSEILNLDKDRKLVTVDTTGRTGGHKRRRYATPTNDDQQDGGNRQTKKIRRMQTPARPRRQAEREDAAPVAALGAITEDAEDEV